MDNSGHLSGVGFIKNGHDDINPLNIAEITRIPEIVKNAKSGDVIPHQTSHAKQRFTILGDARSRQIVIVDIVNNGSINIVTSYKVSERSYQRLMWEAMQNEY